MTDMHVPHGRGVAAQSLLPVLLVAILASLIIFTLRGADAARQHADKVACATVRSAGVDQHRLLTDFLVPKPNDRTQEFLARLLESVEDTYDRCVTRVG